ncbi:copper-binding protein [Ensifer adhaerens]|uniref:copper-binding protein n=1 Tax=Ensifer TaxID=106591 RepID=UPI0007246C45|nr:MULTISPECIES: copper-binding protein [Ensifer]KSV64100.1 signal peptide protein [Sinorhizobium sp. GL2]MBD9498898.1 copper-binding protein [Ensifer sp. ENS01]MBD9573367.1 copper-binding protein [Ensifer sp. ENS08]MBW0366658.1 copper-binding protein [Ensifer adhaerens]UCM18397.1 copper-binding protein [Ensifer adhaerens]
MKTLIKLTLASVLALGTAYGALAAEFTKGTVKKIDAKAKKVTLIHEELKSLDMPAMTMVFRVKDDAVMEKLKEGASVEFVAERVDGKLTVTEVK